MHRKELASNKIAAVLVIDEESFIQSELSYMEEKKPKLPELIFLMKDGGCVTRGDGPFILYYPIWEMVEHFTGAKISHYNMYQHRIEEWDINSTEYGPMS